MLLSVLEILRARGGAASGDAAPLFGWWQPDDSNVRGAFLVTPPYPILLSPTPLESLEPLARVLASAGRPLAGVNAEPAAALGFAAAWQQHTGATAKTSMRQRLLRLGELVPPAPAPPRPRTRGPRRRSRPARSVVVRLRPGGGRRRPQPRSHGRRPPQLRWPDPMGGRWAACFPGWAYPAGSGHGAGGPGLHPAAVPPPRLRGWGDGRGDPPGAEGRRPRGCSCSPTWPTPQATPSTRGSGTARSRTCSSSTSRADTAHFP